MPRSPDLVPLCDQHASRHAKDVVKAVKKRLQNKNPMVQLLSLTLLETMINNCGDYVHLQVAERKILQEMIKIVRKKNIDIRVRDKILVLLDSWQQSFGGPMGKFPQYYWAYDELRRSGVEFPRRSVDAVPIFTQITRQTPRHSLGGCGIPSNSIRTLDEAMASDTGSLSLSDLISSQSVMELLAEMLQAVNPNDHQSVKDEVIVDLASRCRSNHKKLVQLLNSTRDEELLGQGLVLNDSLQTLLAKYDAIASDSSLPTQAVGTSSKPIAPSATITSSLPNEGSLTRPRVTAPAKAMAVSTCQIEEADDDYAQLARRCSQMSPMSSQSVSAETITGTAAVPASTTCNALALSDPPAPVRTTRKEQDMIELLSITLCTDFSSPRTTLNPPSSSTPLTPPPSHEAEQPQAFLNEHGYPSSSQNNSVHQGQISYDSYVVPWSQPQRQPLPYTSSYSATSRSTPSSSHQGHHNPSSFIPHPYETSQANHTCQLSTTTYPYQTSQPNHTGQPSTTTYPYQTPQANHILHVARPMQHISFGPRGSNTQSMLGGAQVSINQRDVAPRPLQHCNSLGSRGNTQSAFGEAVVSANPSPFGPTPLQKYNSFGSRWNTSPSTFGSSAGNKPFVPTHRLFEELVDLRTADGGMKTKSMASLSATSNKGEVGGRK
ncbi:hypothetical protein AAC387_Pa11g0915 [Persea americana]